MTKNHRTVHIIDKFSLQGIRLEPQLYRGVADYCWDHYSYFANQRSLIVDKLKDALAINARKQTFEHWRRLVSYKYTLDPLSARGSILSSPGGRFNIGDLNETKFPRFPALYIAENSDTAYKEKYGLYDPNKKAPGLTAENLAIGGNQTNICVKGQINQVLDLTDQGTLKDFFNIIKNIKLPSHFLKRARQLNIEPMRQVTSMKELRQTILDPNWRYMPSTFDVPANPQILGQIAYVAGIEAILYPSRMSNKDLCLAIFPENLVNSTSFVEIEGEIPEELVKRRLNAETYLNFI